ncbi:MAG: hypothetical protein L6R48_07355 [Planctomycetes bacterium]|nr:hypothetical protein [Planctomycetota bacterium]
MKNTPSIRAVGIVVLAALHGFGFSVEHDGPDKMKILGASMTNSGRIDRLFSEQITPRIIASVKSGDNDRLKEVRSAFEGIVEAWRAKGSRSDEMPNFRDEFFHRPAMMRAYRVMDKAGIMDDGFRRDIRELVEDHYVIRERGPNNRAANFALGCAMAANTWPDSSMATMWRDYAEAVWADWYVPGDTYEPAYTRFHGDLIRLGVELGKLDDLRGDKLRMTYDRYLGMIGPNGFVVSPGDGGVFSADHFHDLFVAIMEVAPSPEYCWALKMTFLAQGNSEEQFSLAYPQYRALVPRPPEWKARVLHRWPATFRVPDQIVLSPGRHPSGSFASFWIWDDCNYLYHGGISDTRGDLTHYQHGGTMLLADLGRYDWPGWNNTLVVGESDSEFPFPRTEGLRGGRWYRGSANLRVIRPYMASARFPQSTIEVPGHYGFEDRERPLGVLLGNPDAISGKNDTISLNSVTLEFAVVPLEGETKASKVFPGRTWWGGYEYRNVCPSAGPVDIMVSDLAVAGPKGTATIAALNEITNNIEVTFVPPGNDGVFKPRTLKGSELDEVLRVVDDPATGRPVLRIRTCHGRTVLKILLPGLAYDVNKDYNRIELSYKYVNDLTGWVRAPIAIGINGSDIQQCLRLDQQQGGILNNSQADSKGGDAAGSVSYSNIWTSDSSWTRRFVLTSEGVLVVRDDFLPGPSADGKYVGPVWQFWRAPESGSIGGATADWFDADAGVVPVGMNVGPHSKPNDSMRLFAAFMHVPGRVNGVQYQPKHWNANTYAVFSRARATACRAETFVTVFIPHPSDVSPESIVEKGKGLRMKSEASGRVTIDINPIASWGFRKNLHIEIGTEGWGVARK